MASMKLFRYL